MHIHRFALNILAWRSQTDTSHPEMVLWNAGCDSGKTFVRGTLRTPEPAGKAWWAWVQSPGGGGGGWLLRRPLCGTLAAVLTQSNHGDVEGALPFPCHIHLFSLCLLSPSHLPHTSVDLTLETFQILSISSSMALIQCQLSEWCPLC